MHTRHSWGEKKGRKRAVTVKKPRQNDGVTETKYICATHSRNLLFKLNVLVLNEKTLLFLAVHEIVGKHASLLEIQKISPRNKNNAREYLFCAFLRIYVKNKQTPRGFITQYTKIYENEVLVIQYMLNRFK